MCNVGLVGRLRLRLRRRLLLLLLRLLLNALDNAKPELAAGRRHVHA